MKLDNIIDGVFGFPKRQIFIIDDIIDAIGGMGQAGINYAAQNATNQANLQIARETNEANKKLYEQQYADQVAMWEMNNAYNDPSAQMSRLRSAGLNPALNMGTNPTGSAQMASAPTPHPAVTGAPMQAPQFNFSDSFKALTDAFLTRTSAQGQQIDNQYKDEINRQQIMKSLSETQRNIEETKNNPVMRAYWRAQKDYLLNELAFNTETFEPRKQSVALQNDLLRTQKAAAEEQGKMYAAQKAYNDSLTSLNITQGSYQARQLQAAIAATLSQASVNNALSGLYLQDATLYDERKKNLIADTLVKNMHANGLKLSNEQTYKMLPHVIEGIRLQNQYLKTQNTQGLMNMFFKPFELGQSMFKSVGGAGAAVLGTKGFKAKYNDDYWNQWSPSTTR